jgi:RsiW-degrading membrane proteinase PrsW (M82 family)
VIGVAERAAKTAQLTAIEQSGWGLPFRLLQPRNVAFWVYLVGLGVGLVAMLRYFAQSAGFYAPALAGGVVLFGLYLVPWLLLLRRQNRYTKLPVGLLACGLAWGAMAAPFGVALPANTALMEIWTKVGGTAFASDWAAGLTAPINEEWSKALGLVLLIGLAPRLVRSAYDGFLLGAFIGLGFQVFEDLAYVYIGARQTFGVDQLGAALETFVARGASGIVTHVLFSAVFCAGVMWVLGRVPNERHVVGGVLAMLAATVFHFVWDDMSGFGGGNRWVQTLLPFIIGAVELVAVFVVRRRAARLERSWTRDLLGPEVEIGAVNPELLSALSGLRKDRRAYRKGLQSRRRARHLVRAASGLAGQIAAAGGAETPSVERARSEVVRLREALVPRTS